MVGPWPFIPARQRGPLASGRSRLAALGVLLSFAVASTAMAAPPYVVKPSALSADRANPTPVVFPAEFEVVAAQQNLYASTAGVSFMNRQNLTPTFADEAGNHFVFRIASAPPGEVLEMILSATRDGFCEEDCEQATYYLRVVDSPDNQEDREAQYQGVGLSVQRRGNVYSTTYSYKSGGSAKVVQEFRIFAKKNGRSRLYRKVRPRARAASFLPLAPDAVHTDVRKFNVCLRSFGIIRSQRGTTYTYEHRAYMVLPSGNRKGLMTKRGVYRPCTKRRSRTTRARSV